MKAVTRITFFDEENEKFFGEGPARLLHLIEETGSLNQAASSMGMAYTKALRIIKNAEKALGIKLTVRAIGGKSGGGSKLTNEGREWLIKYEAFRDACVLENKKLYKQFFEQDKSYGLVVMASGLGKRFGGDKLLFDFNGQPMLDYVVNASKGLFNKTVVVTRNEAVKKHLENTGVKVIFHELPFRSDTVRLGLEAIMEGLDGCVFCPADQPLISPDTFKRLICEGSANAPCIVRASYGDRVGAPVLFTKDFFEELLRLEEGNGGSAVIKAHPELVRRISVDKEEELLDIDTKEDLETLLSYLR